MSRASRRVLGSAAAQSSQLYSTDQRQSSLNSSPATAEAEFEGLECPICSKSMISLQYLNDHLDTDHNEVANAVHEIGVRSWFQRQIIKGTKLGPVAAISKTLKLNEDFQRNGSPAGRNDSSQDTDELVSRSHWQSEVAECLCSFPGCDPKLSNRYRPINCRHCGKIFCERHTLYQMRLSRSANYEPVRGIWCRVCELCYTGREWYCDKEGTSKDHLLEFNAHRKQVVDRLYLDRNRLEKRLGILLQAIAAEAPDTRSFSSFFTKRGSQQKLVEQYVVPWEDEALEDMCRICRTLYSYDNPNSHCRLCGKVVCVDRVRKCSTIEEFDVRTTIEKHNSPKISLRLCSACLFPLFGRQALRDQLSSVPAYGSSYTTLQSYEVSIERLMPRFRGLLTSLNDDTQNRKSQLIEIRRVRQRLQDAFAQFEAAAKKIKSTPTEIKSERKIQEAIYKSAVQFLQQHMVTLQSIPVSDGGMVSKDQGERAESPEAIEHRKDQRSLHEELTSFTEQRVSQICKVIAQGSYTLVLGSSAVG